VWQVEGLTVSGQADLPGGITTTVASLELPPGTVLP
jgi:hypothetical protein